MRTPDASTPQRAAECNQRSFLLVCGYLAIRRRSIALHQACMVATVVTSCVFLASYVTYHAAVGSVRFQGQGWILPG